MNGRVCRHKIELEKDRLLNCFLEFGEELCKKIRKAGYWADYIDPWTSHDYQVLQ